MDINSIEPNQYVDLFGDTLPKDKTPGVNFQGNTEQNTDILTAPVPDPEPKLDKTPIVESTKLGEDGTPLPDEQAKEADILGAVKPKKLKYNFNDITGYFTDRFKSGKFVAVEEEDDKGVKTQFIPKTPEDFDEVIDIQVNYKLDEQKKDLEKRLYSSKSPAWQAVLKYSEMVEDPSEIIPFLNSVNNIESVIPIDENDEEGAEEIVRIRGQQRGDTEDIIQEQIDALKASDKLISTAKKYKPLIVQEEQQVMGQMAQQKQAEQANYIATVTGIRNNAIKAIDAPIFGKQKLKEEDKHVIYELIAEPSPEHRGYAIYSAIDQLFQTNNFELLRQVALLVGKHDSFMTYASMAAADNTATSLQRKLSAAGAKSSSSTDEGDDTERTVVKRTGERASANFNW